VIASSDDTVLEITRVFDAPPARVFAAWLDLGQFQAWIGPEGVDCKVELLEPAVGGRYRLVMNTAERVIPVSGVFKAIEPDRCLVFTWGWEGDAVRQSLITLTFRNVGERKTELTLRQEGLGSVESRDGHVRGWDSALNKLERHLLQGART
jgi:uncharacterized protein YndB with AHSA1/START domain